MSLARIVEMARATGFLGFISFGGPSVHVVILRKRFVEQLRFLDEVTFQDLFSLSASLPGPGSTQLMFSIALLRAGGIGGILAFFMWSVPGAIGMLLLAIGVRNIPANLPSLVLALLTGLNASAIGLIAFSGYTLSRSAGVNAITLIVLFLSAAISSCYTQIWLFPVLTVSGGIITLIYAEVLRWTEKRKQKVAERKEVVEMEVVEMDDKESNIPSATLQSSSTLRQRNVVSSESIVPPPLVVQNNFHLSIFQIIFTLLIFVAILVTTVVLRSVIQNPSPELRLFNNFFIAGSILFGGGPVVVPLLQGYTSQIVSTQDFLIGFSILQAFPGPNFNFAVYLGTLSIPSNPALGGFLGFVAIFSPGLLLKFALLPIYSKIKHNPRIRATLIGLNCAAIGLIWGSVYRLWTVGLLTDLGGASLEKSGYWISISTLAFGLSHFFKIQPQYVILGGAIAGLIYGGIKGAP